MIPKNNTILKSIISGFLILIGLLTGFANDFTFTPIDATDGLSDNQIRYILQLEDGRMVFTTSGNVNLYDGASFTYIHRREDYVYLLNEYDGHYRVYQSADSLLWIKDYRKLMCIDLKTESYLTDLNTYFQERGIHHQIDDFFMDAQHRIWLQSTNALLQPELGVNLDITGYDGVLQDVHSEGEFLYLFYNTGSLVCYDIQQDKFLYDIPAYPAADRDLFSKTSLVVKGKDGFYQLRNGKKGVFLFFDTKKQMWMKFLETDYILNTLIFTPENKAYVSSVKGIWEWDLNLGNQRFMPALKTWDDKLIDTEISTIFQDAQEGFWVGTLNRGLLYHHPDRYAFKSIDRSAFNLSSLREMIVQSFAEDEAGNLYIKTSTGVYQYFPDTSEAHLLKADQLHALTENTHRQLYASQSHQMYRNKSYAAVFTDSYGRTWAGSADGLILFMPTDTVGRVFYTSDGLVNNFVHAIIEDRNKNIWVTTSCGISQIQMDTVDCRIHFTNYRIEQGTLRNEYVNGSSFEASDGKLYFGGIDGFSVFDSEQEPIAYALHQPILSSLYLHGQPVKINEKYDNRVILSKSTAYTDKIELAYNQNSLMMEFSAMNYRNSSQTHYRYRLENVDKNWIETANNDGVLRIAYAHLQPGKYLLNIAAADNPQSINQVISTLTIIIHAPWWKTKTAYGIYILIAIGMVLGSVYFYLHLAKRKMERIHKEEMLLLRIKNLIEQYNLLEAEHESEPNDEADSKEHQHLNPQDADFLAKAMKLVESNMEQPDYTVDRLSRDLHMDRTGLYRKLMILLDKSPSVFIRNIRLQKAANLLLEGKHSIAEIADKTGFSSSSYLSKCFQETFGCRPSEYQTQHPNNTKIS